MLALGGSGVYLTLQTARHFHPGLRRKNRALDSLQDSLLPWCEALVPLSPEELSQLSFRLLRQSRRSGVAPTRKGLFATIYHEAVVAWAYQRFPGFGHQAVALAILAEGTFRFLVGRTRTTVLFNGTPLATIHPDGRLQPADSSRLPVTIRREDPPAAWLLLLGPEPAARLLAPTRGTSHAPRALTLLSPHTDILTPTFLAALLWVMVRQEAGYPFPAVEKSAPEP